MKCNDLPVTKKTCWQQRHNIQVKMLMPTDLKIETYDDDEFGFPKIRHVIDT